MEAHTTLATAMNRVGAKSNTGEGGTSNLIHLNLNDFRNNVIFN